MNPDPPLILSVTPSELLATSEPSVPHLRNEANHVPAPGLGALVGLKHPGAAARSSRNSGPVKCVPRLQETFVFKVDKMGEENKYLPRGLGLI